MNQIPYIINESSEFWPKLADGEGYFFTPTTPSELIYTGDQHEEAQPSAFSASPLVVKDFCYW